MLALLVCQQAQPAEGTATLDGASPAAAAEPDAAVAAAGQLEGLSLSNGEPDAAAAGSAAGQADAAAAGGAGSAGAGGEGAGVGTGAPAPSMDALLEAAVVAGLRQTTNAELPMQTGDFYTKKMLACKPEGGQKWRHRSGVRVAAAKRAQVLLPCAGVVFDFKQSSCKKLGYLELLQG
jgi:hypothetical protein